MIKHRVEKKKQRDKCYIFDRMQGRLMKHIQITLEKHAGLLGETN